MVMLITADLQCPQRHSSQEASTLSQLPALVSPPYPCSGVIPAPHSPGLGVQDTPSEHCPFGITGTGPVPSSQHRADANQLPVSGAELGLWEGSGPAPQLSWAALWGWGQQGGSGCSQ